MSATHAREGRTTCRVCRKPLDNGQPLTDETVEITEVWGRNSVGFVRRPIQAIQTPVAMHASCAAQAAVDQARSQVRRWREQIDELVEDGASSSRIAKAAKVLAEKEAELEAAIAAAQ